MGSGGWAGRGVGGRREGGAGGGRLLEAGRLLGGRAARGGAAAGGAGGGRGRGVEEGAAGHVARARSTANHSFQLTTVLSQTERGQAVLVNSSLNEVTTICNSLFFII